MITNDVKNQFVELRVKGLSYDKIAQELQVTKQTLINWSKEYKYDILNLRKIEKEALLDRLELSEKARLERLSEILKKAYTELISRDLSKVSTEKLYDLVLKYMESNKNIIMPMMFTINEDMNVIDFNNEKQWSED